MESQQQPQSPFVGMESVSPSSAESHKELRALLEQSIALSTQVLSEQETIKRRLRLMVIGSYVRLFVILIPLILGIIYLPALLEKIIEEYNGLFRGIPTASTTLEHVETFLKEWQP